MVAADGLAVANPSVIQKMLDLIVKGARSKRQPGLASFWLGHCSRVSTRHLGWMTFA
jgi:hypothetical protein